MPTKRVMGKAMPDQMEMVEILDVGIGDDEHSVVKNKVELKGLAVDQKPDQKKRQTSQKIIRDHEKIPLTASFTYTEFGKNTV